MGIRRVAALSLLLALLLASLLSPTLRAQQPDPDRAKAWEGALHYPQACMDDAVRRHVQLQPRYHALDAKRYLVEVGCTWAAYQGTEVFFLLDTSGPQPSARLLEFSNYQDTGSGIEKVRAAELPGDAEWDAKTRQLRIFEKFSGAGDCGLYQVYSIAGEQPKLVTARAKIKCDGRAIRDPRPLPVLPQFVTDSQSQKP